MNDIRPIRRRGRPRADSPHPMDVHVGRQIKSRRALLGMSQERLAHFLGLTFQQVQKYERGINRIGAGRLFELSRILSCEVGYFFEGAPDPTAASTGLAPGMSEAATPFDHGETPSARRETAELVRAYWSVGDSAMRRRVFELVKTMAAAGRPDEGGREATLGNG